MLCEAEVRPFSVFHCFFVFLCVGLDRAVRFSYIYCFLTAAALEVVMFLIFVICLCICKEVDESHFFAQRMF